MEEQGHVLAQNIDVQSSMFLQAHRLSTLSLVTVYRWMTHLGMKYRTKSKSYYVDGHERKDVVIYQNWFVNKYLREWEPHCLWFVHMTLEELQTIQLQTIRTKPKLLEKDCLKFACDDGSFLFEVHEDRLHKMGNDNLQRRCDELPRQQSIRSIGNNTKPLIIVGQDECIFYQYMLNLKGWVGTKGERCLDPKTVGEGYMISAFKSRDLGFGHRPFTNEEIIRINLHRQGKCYVDTEAAMELLGSVAKDDHPMQLGGSPFVRYLQIGKNKEGYWSSAHMAVQFEDVIDCCLALYGDTFDFLFIFDHSCGHDRRPTGALDAKALNVGFGGSQPSLKESNIVCFQGYLGEHPGLLIPGDTQAFQYQEGDIGPHYLTDAQREQRKYDQPTGRLLSKTKTKKELTGELLSRGLVDAQNVPNGLAELQQRATLHNIDLKKNVEEVLEGWIGKAKGLSQIAWERGLLDPLLTYTKNRLVEILAACTDFETQKRTLGVKAERSPKFHCELAGEGIEYDWAYCKQQYRRRPLPTREEAKTSRTWYMN